MLRSLLLLPLIAITISLNTTGQTLLKMGTEKNIFNWYLFSGLVAYGFSTIFYILILSKLNLSVVYPVVFGLTIIATTLAGSFFFKETVTPTHWVGIGLTISGISAIAFGKIS